MGSTYILPFLKGLTNIEVKIVVIRIFDQSDNVYGLEYVGDNAYKRLASSLTTSHITLPSLFRIGTLDIALLTSW